MQYSFAAFCLVLMAPLFLVIGLLIKLTSPGPLLYRGLRVGKEGRIFTIYKFRTLQVDAEERIGACLLTDRDAYYTRLGKFLKRTKLDELPQLLNVLKGEMNLVGPRPIRPIFLETLCRDIPRYPIQFAAKTRDDRLSAGPWRVFYRSQRQAAL
jgi:lipopolysaccharide/colanic/teichoic acid biosynthesis glycosyltransferase